MSDLGARTNPTEALNRYWGAGGASPTSYSQGVLANAQKFQGALGPALKEQAQRTRARGVLGQYGVAPPAPGGAPGGGIPVPTARPVSKRFVNPLPGWGQSRTDMGIDFSAPSGTPILAMGKGRFLGVGQGPGWPGTPGGETGVLYQLKKSKGLPSPYVFAYEGVRTNPKLQPGQKLHKGDVVGYGSGGGIETGYATSSGGTLSVAHGTQSHERRPRRGADPGGTRLSEPPLEAARIDRDQGRRDASLGRRLQHGSRSESRLLRGSWRTRACRQRQRHRDPSPPLHPGLPELRAHRTSRHRRPRRSPPRTFKRHSPRSSAADRRRGREDSQRLDVPPRADPPTAAVPPTAVN